jgi:hypothetical protein
MDEEELNQELRNLAERILPEQPASGNRFGQDRRLVGKDGLMVWSRFC